jgi:transposase-like protein
MKSTNMLECLNQEIKRRTHVVRIFPSAESCLRLVRALAVETHENWLEGSSWKRGRLGQSTYRRCDRLGADWIIVQRFRPSVA